MGGAERGTNLSPVAGILFNKTCYDIFNVNSPRKEEDSGPPENKNSWISFIDSDFKVIDEKDNHKRMNHTFTTVIPLLILYIYI